MKWFGDVYQGKGLSRLHFIDGIMNSQAYVEILCDYMLRSARDILGRRFQFQHNNDPKHTSKQVTEFFRQKKVKVLVWPPTQTPQSTYGKKWRNGNMIKSQKNYRKLKDVLQTIWDEIKSRICFFGCEKFIYLYYFSAQFENR